MNTPRVGGRPAKELNEAEISELETLASILSKEQIAAYFGMTEKTLSAVTERQPEVFTAYRRGKARAVVKVASALMRAAEEGDMRAIQFFLKTQAGWTEKRYFEINQAETEQSEDRTWTIEVVGTNADGTEYRYGKDEGGKDIVIDHDGKVYPAHVR